MKATLYAILVIVAFFVIAASVTSCTYKCTTIDNCPQWKSKTK
jgi:hypothetical protein